jgi:hypothetical protein
MPTLPRTNGETIMIPTVEANGGVILGDQNCSTCKLTFPICGKKKAVYSGFCRSPFVSLNDNQQTEVKK